MTKTKLINADDKTVKQVLGQKFNIDFFQREYNWQRKHVEQLLSDLEGKFRSFYFKSHERRDVSDYGRYYLGPVILSEKKGMKSIIDGQQRLTTMNLLLIFLRHLIKNDVDLAAKIAPLIYSESYGEKSYNLQIKGREKCMDGLYKEGKYDIEVKDESVNNLIARYQDIEELFSEDLQNETLPYFIDWLIDNVIFVEIVTYSDEDAYTIFETMNDRGLSLTPTQMLKGFLLSLLNNDEEKNELNELWKNKISKFHEIDKTEDLEFFKAWLRAKYAESIRAGKKGSSNEDFEKIGTRFHSWVRDNIKKVGLKGSNEVYEFVDKNFKFYSDIYFKIDLAIEELTKGLESIYYIDDRGLASSLYFPLLLSSITLNDDKKTINKKLALVSYYLELFVVFRSVNRRIFSHSGIRYTMYNLVKEIRDLDIDSLAKLLKEKASEIEEGLEGIKTLILTGQNKRFIKFLLARITKYIEEESGMPSNFKDYMDPDLKKPFEIEHLWANKFEEHDDFEQRDEFEKFRNNVGALILLPRGFNQSFNDLPYEGKLPHYLGQNLLAKSLHPQTYEKNPSFNNFIKNSGLNFKPHPEFKKKDILERQKLYQEISEKIWNINKFDIIRDE
ncbi:DUF262 domain-containing protein [archaeon]|jgi:uncharacterized protein with ParB-like and HNH nuclease domain|nr:DUF262 domain-containing protein [archaeon]MBT5287453.1 DUF262 domain-containing protein [archaeon]MBT7440156.1 DUF262 domain-containing protein [archaeon]